MLSKDQAFAIHEFITYNSHKELWEVSEELIKITSELIRNDQQKQILNKFLIKNSTSYVSKTEKYIYKMIQDILSNKHAIEEEDLVN